MSENSLLKIRCCAYIDANHVFIPSLLSASHHQSVLIVSSCLSIPSIMTPILHLFLAAAAISSVSAAPASTAAGADAPNLEMGRRDALVARAALNYNQDYKTGGTVDYEAASSGYSVAFSGASDFVVGKGWTKGTNR